MNMNSKLIRMMRIFKIFYIMIMINIGMIKKIYARKDLQDPCVFYVNKVIKKQEIFVLNVKNL